MTFTPGTFFVVETSGFVGQVIRAATRGRANHAGIIVDATGRTIEMRPQSRWRWWRGACVYGQVPANAYVITPRNAGGSPLRPKQLGVVVAMATRYLELGTRYNLLGLLTLFLAQRGVRWWWVLAVCKSTRDLFCSQQVDLCLALAGVPTFDDGRPPGNVSPEDLIVLAQQSGWAVDYLGKHQDMRL